MLPGWCEHPVPCTVQVRKFYGETLRTQVSEHDGLLSPHLADGRDGYLDDTVLMAD
jgi:hypothetical protein